MRADRHGVEDAALSKALSAVPEELDREVSLAENGGACGIEMISDVLLDYVAARSAAADPRIEDRDTWTALRTATEMATDFARACATPVGGTVRSWVEYLGVGFGFTNEFEETLSAGDVVHAFHLALICRLEPQLASYVGLLRQVAEDRHTAETRALYAYWIEEAAPADAPPVVRAIIEEDQTAFDAALAEMLDRHRQNARGVRDLLAWEALAMAAAAHDAGLTVSAESDYLPLRLVTNTGPRKAGAAEPVARPPFDAERAAGWLEGALDRKRDAPAHYFRPKMLVSARSGAFKRYAESRLLSFSFRSVLDPRAEDIQQWTDLVLASQAAAQAFRLAGVPRDTEIEVTLGGHTGTLAASGPTSDAAAWDYTRAVAFAFVTRSADDLAVLAAVDPSLLDGSRPLADTRSYAHALRAHLTGGDVRTHLDSALREGYRDDHWECLRDPQVRLLDRLHENDRDGFNRVLAEALDLYRQYHSVGDRVGDPDGQVAINVLGLACHAHDQGFPITVESDYLPRRLVEGTWVGTPPDLVPFG